MDYRELNVPAQIHQAVERMGFTEMTEVQEKAIPPMMEGGDIIAKAPTGTGKTCAFGIPLIAGLDPEKKYPVVMQLYGGPGAGPADHRGPAGSGAFLSRSASGVRVRRRQHEPPD